MDMKQKFITHCAQIDCKIQRDQKSAEQNITYTDASGNSHVVWFEDENSV